MGREKTNIFADGEVAAFSPDAKGDYYKIDDAQRDSNYWQAKIADILIQISQDPTKNFFILYGGEVSDGGAGTIDVSAGAAITVDDDDEVRMVVLPAQTGLAFDDTDLPTAWKDDRQIWMIGKYDFKYTADTRAHREGTTYHYILEDTFFGDDDGYASGDIADAFVDADPNVSEVVVCWGSFKMSAGDVFTDMDSGERTRSLIARFDEIETDVISEKTAAGVTIDGSLIKDGVAKFDAINEKTVDNGVDIEGIHFENSGVRVNWTSAQQVGIDLNIAGTGFPSITALNGTDVAFIDSGQKDLRVYRFDGNVFAKVGIDLNIDGIGTPSITALNGTDIASIGSAQEVLRVYRFDGNVFAQVGIDLNIAGIGVPSITALNGTDVAFIDETQKDLRVYRFDGNVFAQVGIDLNIVGIGIPSITALNGTDIAFIGSAQEDLRVYRFDGNVFAQVGIDLNIAGIGNPSITALNGTDVAFIDGTLKDLRVYRFDGNVFAQVGIDLNIAGISTSSITVLNGTDVAFIDATQDDLRVYRFGFSLSELYALSWI